MKNREEQGIPWWAAVVAPMIGIPMLVALLALAAPRESGEIVSQGDVIEAVDSDAITIDEELVVVRVPVDGSFHEG